MQNWIEFLEVTIDKAIKDFDVRATILMTPGRGTAQAVSQLDDILAEDLADYTQQMEKMIKLTPPVDAQNFKKWISQLRQVDTQIGQIDPNVEKIYGTH